MAITVENLSGSYEFYSTMDGYCLVRPDGTRKYFESYSQVEEYWKEVEEYCKKKGIGLAK